MQTNAAGRNSGWLDNIDFVTPLWRQRALLWQFTQRNVELRHKGSHLGLIWSFLNPLLMLTLYVFVFGFIFGGRFGALPNESPVDYALGVFVSLSIFHFVAEVLGVGPTIIVSNPNFVKKVVFPLEILPAAAVGAAFVHFLISILLTLAGIAVFGPGMSWDMLWLPVIFVPILLMAVGLAWFQAAFGVFFRDVNQLTAAITTGLMFASAVFFPAKQIVEKSAVAWAILRFNPFIHANELSRSAAMWHLPMNYNHLAYLYLVGLATAFAGYYCFRRLRPAFADVL